jgi:hypothetical protein
MCTESHKATPYKFDLNNEQLTGIDSTSMMSEYIGTPRRRPN